MDMVKSPRGYISEMMSNTTASTKRALSAVFQYPVNQSGKETVDVINPSKLGDNDMMTGRGTELTSAVKSPGAGAAAVGVHRSVSSKITLGTGYSDDKVETL